MGTGQSTGIDHGRDYPSIDAFLDARAAGDGSRHPLTSDRHDLIGFARWFAEHVPIEAGFAPDAVTPTDVREAQRKPATVNRKLAARRAYFTFWCACRIHPSHLSLFNPSGPKAAPRRIAVHL